VTQKERRLLVAFFFVDGRVALMLPRHAKV
jgi:hypothetical protein